MWAGGDVEMSATESVIKDLNIAKFILCNPQMLNPEMCIRIGQAINSAIDLLTPRVLTLEELKEGESYWLTAGKDFIPQPVICVHREDDALKPYITFACQYGTCSLKTESYGKTWYCWTAKPTDEQNRR